MNAGGAAARADFERAVGEVLLTLGAHPLYEQLFLHEIGDRIIPPLVHHQYRFLHDEDGGTIGYLSWALMDSAATSRLLAGEKMRREDWRSGDTAVIVDAIAPSAQAARQLMDKVKKECFPRAVLKRIDAEQEPPVLEDVR